MTIARKYPHLPVLKVEEKESMRLKKLIFSRFFLLLVLTIFLVNVSPVNSLAATPPPLKLPNGFTDYETWPVWAQPSLELATEWHILQGYSDGSLRPNLIVTRAEFAAMLARAMGQAVPDPGQAATRPPFANLAESSWYYPYLQSLASDGILSFNLYPTGFEPNQPITRGEAAAWCGLALQYYGVKGNLPPPTWSDLPTSTNGYREILLAAQAGIVQGYPGGVFQPYQTLTRAQGAAMLIRFIDALPGSEQLLRQTIFLPQFIQTAMDSGWNGSSANAVRSEPATVLTATDVSPNLPIDDAAFAKADYVSWQQIHLWIATGNWIALGEAKLNQQEANYIVSYGLEPWQVAFLESAVFYYSSTALPQDFPLRYSLYPIAATYPGGPDETGKLNPVTAISITNPDHPFLMPPSPAQFVSQLSTGQSAANDPFTISPGFQLPLSVAGAGTGPMWHLTFDLSAAPQIAVHWPAGLDTNPQANPEHNWYVVGNQ